MKSFTCAAALLFMACSVADAAIITDGGSNNRPISIDMISIAGNDYSVVFQYDIAQSTTSGIGDLPTVDIAAAVAQLASAFTTPLITPGFDPLVIQFVTSTGSGIYDSSGALRFLIGSWSSFPGGVGTGIPDSAENGLGVVSFTSLAAPSVPEPSSLALLAMATCGGVLVYRKNRKSNQVAA